MLSFIENASVTFEIVEELCTVFVPSHWIYQGPKLPKLVGVIQKESLPVTAFHRLGVGNLFCYQETGAKASSGK